jgi:methylamine dehydrogenase heavy chain
VVDLASRDFVTEVDIPGCFNIYATGNRRLNALCSHGGFMTIEFDDAGKVLNLVRSDALFDAYDDPVTVSGVRVGDVWYHLSMDGYMHGFRSDKDGVTALPRWSLFSDDERDDEWRISGFQHLAIHADSGRAYVLVHQGAPETFEDPGTHVWVYDLASGARIEEVELERIALSIEVSQDADAQLYALAADFNIPALFQVYLYLTEGAPALEKIADFVLDVYQAQTGKLLRSVKEVGAFPTYIQVWPKTVVGAADD